ncbi:TRAP transporter small permease [Nostoc sp. CHAB 5836]|nr:TRAP transporter small permease [Nostoc sp. CHAB 5836]
MITLSRVVRLIARLAVALGSIATVTCLLLIGYAVAMRYLLGQPQPWVDKVAGWLVLALVMLAAPEAQRRFEHIGVDVAVGKLGPRLARVAHLVGALSVATVALVLLLAGLEAIAFSRMVGLMTEIGGVPEWWVQLLLPVGAGLLLLVSLAQALVLATGRTPEHLPAPDEDMPRDPLARAE